MTLPFSFVCARMHAIGGKFQVGSGLCRLDTHRTTGLAILGTSVTSHPAISNALVGARKRANPDLWFRRLTWLPPRPTDKLDRILHIC